MGIRGKIYNKRVELEMVCKVLYGHNAKAPHTLLHGQMKYDRWK